MDNSESLINARKDRPDCLNLESEHCDPEAVLSADVAIINIPDLNAKTYNHLDEYAKKSGATQLGLIGDLPSTSSIPVSVKSDREPGKVITNVSSREDKWIINEKEREEELKKTLTPNVRFQRKDKKSVLSFMNSDVNGPQSFLFKCVGQSVKVNIRRRKIIFHHHEQLATIYGSLIAFDKHYNLILSNVIEKVKLIASGGIDDDLPKTVRRSLKTLFIRGSNVLTVSLDSPNVAPVTGEPAIE